MGKDVKENIGGIFGKSDGFLHVWCVSLGLEHIKREAIILDSAWKDLRQN